MRRGACPVCGCQYGVTVVRRDNVPVHQNLVFKERRAAQQIARGDLDFRACARCGFVFNAAFDPARLSYGADYDNTQLSSPTFRAYVDGLVQHVVNNRGVRGVHIVEVGCGKGAFVRALVNADPGNTGVGFDPSYVGPDTDCMGRLRFERRFYDESCTDIPADVVASRHVIEHVPEPLELLRAIKSALVQRPGARIFLETPCVDWILRNQVVWDLFYEHCSLFTAESLSTACMTAGFTVESVTHLFGGQYLWLEAVNTPPNTVTYAAGDTPALASAFAQAEAEQRERWRRFVAEQDSRSTLAIWGAGAKGATLANLVDPDGTRLACIVDVNPAKQGGFMAGTGHSIVAPRELGAFGVTHALLLNPNYRAEVEAQLRADGLDVEVLDIGSPSATAPR